MDQEQQSIETKKGEIRFRRELSRQQLAGEARIPESFSEDEIIPVLAGNIEETRRVLGKLSAQQVRVSPFLELGAERGERSYLLRDSGAFGFAFDLSLDALLFGERLGAAFGLTDSPFRICGDAYNLPFRSNTLAFVLCFATLHHFPDPLPIVQEAIRVLQDGGHFYFDREPARGRLTIRLWTRYGHRLSRFESLLNRLGVLGFVSEGGGLEREYGILEKDFPLETWTDLATLFDRVEMRVNKTLKIRFDPMQPSLERMIARLVGGVTSGLCHVRGDAPPVPVDDWIEMLRCPNCSGDDGEFGLKLLAPGKGMQCENCKTIYPEHDGVFLLLNRELQHALYPDQGSA
jgi:SAM-dependent methyltransferase